MSIVQHAWVGLRQSLNTGTSKVLGEFPPKEIERLIQKQRLIEVDGN